LVFYSAKPYLLPVGTRAAAANIENTDTGLPGKQNHPGPQATSSLKERDTPCIPSSIHGRVGDKLPPLLRKNAPIEAGVVTLETS